MTLDDIIQERIEDADSLQKSAFILEKLFTEHEAGDECRIYSKRQLVEFMNGLRIEIRHNEHRPPHFHVIARGINASFSVEKCELLNGSIGGPKRKMVERWYKWPRHKLIKLWNETRSSECSVDPIEINRSS